jgi:hypothetical protein
MKTFKELLIELSACLDAREWAADMTVEDVVAKCHRGDWLLWLAMRICIDHRKMTLAKGHCANTVRHIMKDERSIKAVDAAISYGNLEIIKADLEDAADAAARAADAAAYAAADAAARAADAAADAAAYAAAAAADSADAAYAAGYAAAARKSNQMQTADICREIIGQEIIDKVNKILNTQK